MVVCTSSCESIRGGFFYLQGVLSCLHEHILWTQTKKRPRIRVPETVDRDQPSKDTGRKPGRAATAGNRAKVDPENDDEGDRRPGG